MNKRIRKEIADITKKLEHLENRIGELASDEQEKFDSIPEALQDTESALLFEEHAETLEEAQDCVNEAIAKLSNCTDEVVIQVPKNPKSKGFESRKEFFSKEILKKNMR